MTSLEPNLELIPGRFIGKGHPCFVIAEIGQNHQGDLNIAKQLISAAKDCGADCVKFQKSNLEEKFTASALNRSYTSIHSWGKTYGEHKKYLELSDNDYAQLKHFADTMGIIFSSSGMDKSSMDFLNKLGVPFFKIGSGDANNFPLIEHTAKFGKPLIISSGMQSLKTMRLIYEKLLPITPFCFLQCTSCYPTLPQDVHLRVIKNYQREFPGIPIGYSGHENGISISIAAVALGANVIERHFTLDKSWKGNDHSSSLDPTELRSLVNEIRVVEQAMGNPNKQFNPCELSCQNKLGKSIVASRDISIGERLTEDMVNIKVSEPKGIKPEEIYNILGRTVSRTLTYDEPIQQQDLS